MQIRRIGIALALHRPRSDWLAEQLRSIQEQTLTDWTCVLSFDSPATVMSEPAIATILADRRFRYIENQRRLGAAKNFEGAIRAALADDVDAVACCDYDDRWHPDKLAVLADALSRAGPGSVVHSDLELFGEGGGLGRAWRVERRRADHVRPWQILVRNVVTGASMILAADLARRYPEVPAEARLHDRWYALAAACHGGVHAVDRALMSYRVHGAQDTGLAPYRGLLAPPPGVAGALPFLRECVRVWRNAHELLGAALIRGMPVPAGDAALYLRPDLGAGLLLASGRALGSGDPVLARALAAAALGKAASAVTRGRVRPLPERTALH